LPLGGHARREGNRLFLDACRLYLKQRRREQIKSVREFYQRLGEGRARLTSCDYKLVESNADEEENWITVNGARVKIEKGQSKEEAVKSFTEKKELVSFASSAIKNKDEKQTHVVSKKISNKTRDRIKEKTGVDVGDARVEVLSDAVRHSSNKHPDLKDSDWGRLSKMIENFDDAKKLNKTGEHGETRIGFIMQDKASGYAYVADVMIGKKKGARMSVVTFFKDHPNSVKSWLANE